jgi:hypothetical protein
LVILGWYTPPHGKTTTQAVVQEAIMLPLEEVRPDAAPFLLTPRLSDEPVEADEADDVDDDDDDDDDELGEGEEFDDEDELDEDEDLDGDDDDDADADEDEADED